jgi:hypothetical protein
VADNPWCNEIELLLACARFEMREGDIARAARATRAGVDVRLLLRFGRMHRLLPFLHRHAAAGHIELAAPAVSALRRQALSAARRGLMLANELLAALRLLDGAGIPAVPLKGPVLSDRIYGSPTFRQFDDLDVLVPREDLAHAAALLGAHAYRRVSDLPERLQAFEAESLHHLSFSTPSGGGSIELHHSLLSLGSGAGHHYRSIAPRLETRRFMGQPVRVLADADLFVYLCQHGALHGWGRIEWLATAAVLLQSMAAGDCPAIARAAAALEGLGRTRGALALMRDLLDVDPCPAITGSRQLNAANRLVERRLAREPARVKPARPELFAFQILTDDGVRARLRRAYAVLMTPQLADLQSFALPRRAWPLYALLRPFRILARRLRPSK